MSIELKTNAFSSCRIIINYTEYMTGKMIYIVTYGAPANNSECVIARDEELKKDMWVSGYVKMSFIQVHVCV